MVKVRKKPGKPPRYEPTEEEIREACLDIQDTWTPEEEYRRRVIKTSNNCLKEVPTIQFSQD